MRKKSALRLKGYYLEGKEQSTHLLSICKLKVKLEKKTTKYHTKFVPPKISAGDQVTSKMRKMVRKKNALQRLSPHR